MIVDHTIRIRPTVGAMALFVLVSLPAQAGIFDDPENLEVLPEDISTAELRDTMKDFAFATGARCETCHVGEAGEPLTTFDFASDEKEMKKKARIMLRMVADINERLRSKLDKDVADMVQVECVTCHRGQRRPRLLADDLEEAFDNEGLDAAATRYRTLKENYYGSHTFDFSEWSVIPLAERLVARGETDAALRFLDLNLQTNPESISTLVMQAQLQVKSGDKPAAIASLERALQIDPENGFLRKQLNSLK